MRLEVVGMNHRTAEVAVRERLAFDRSAAAGALALFARRWPTAEGVLLSTCNRVEVYAASRDAGPSADALAEFLAAARGLAVEEFAHSLYSHGGRDAVRHLFSVVSGLDSQVVGETQISGQVRDAYHAALDAGTTGVVLNGLFQRSFRVARQVRRLTGIARRPASLGSVAADLAREVLGSLAGRTVLLAGAGETAELVLRHLRRVGAERIVVANRTFARAEELACRYGGEAAPLADLARHLAAADVLVASTGAPGFVVTEETLRRCRPEGGDRPLIVIDLALPRDVEPAAGKVPGVHLYDLDRLEEACAAHRRRHGAEVEQGLEIVERETDAFLAWLSSRSADPVIRDLRSRLEALAREEVERLLAHLPGLAPTEREQIELMMRRFANKLAHRPTVALRRAAARGETRPYLDLARDLFGLGGCSREGEGSAGRRVDP